MTVKELVRIVCLPVALIALAAGAIQAIRGDPHWLAIAGPAAGLLRSVLKGTNS